MEETLRLHLLRLADLYGEANNVTRPSLGLEILRDNTFFRRISDGQGFTVRTYDRVVQWFSDRWPADADWPVEIERPKTEPAPTAAPAEAEGVGA